MGKKTEKIDTHPKYKGKYEKFVKKQTNRIERRAAKKDPESAPKKRSYRGWTT